MRTRYTFRIERCPFNPEPVFEVRLSGMSAVDEFPLQRLRFVHELFVAGGLPPSEIQTSQFHKACRLSPFSY